MRLLSNGPLTTASVSTQLSSEASAQMLASEEEYLQDHLFRAVPNRPQHSLTSGELPEWVLPPLKGSDGRVYRQAFSNSGNDDFLHAFDHYHCFEQLDAQMRFLELEPSQSADADYKKGMREHLQGLRAKHMADCEEDCIPDSEPES